MQKRLDEIIKEISSTYSFYCNQNYRNNGSLELYPRLTFGQFGESVGISKGTVSKIFSAEDESGKPLYKKLIIMWEILGSKTKILKHGRENLKNKQKDQ